MRSNLLIGGLLASVMIVPAFAQSNPPASTAHPAPAATSATTTTNKVFSDQWRASKLIGLNVYNEQNEKLGDISELLLDKSGKVEGVVIGVGGFLGMGQHDIKVDMAKLKFVDEPVKTSSTTTTTHDRCGDDASGWHHHHEQHAQQAVVSGSCGAVRRQQGPAQEHDAVQVRLTGVIEELKKRPRFMPGLFLVVVAVVARRLLCGAAYQPPMAIRSRA